MKLGRFLFLTAALSFAQDRPDPREVLSRADAPIFAAKSVRITATHSHGFANAPPLPGNPFKIEFVRGGKGRAESFAGNSTISLTIFDGTDLWEYHQLGNQYTQKSAAAFPPQSEIENIDYGRRAANILSAAYQPDETIDFKGRPVDCRVILAQYRRAPGLSSIGPASRRVWISKDTEWILRDYWEAGETSTTNYTEIETDIPLPDSLFVFQPPPGSKMGPPVVLGGIIGPIPTARGTLQTRMDPEYSAEARAAGLQGSVILSIEIAPDGHTRNPQLIHALGMGLDEKAIEAVSQWRYDSAPNPNAPILRRAIEIPFRLKPAAPWILDASVFTAQREPDPSTYTDPELLQYTAPDPAACTVQGYIPVNFNIRADGVPADIQITDPAGSMHDSVLRAVQSWRFRPATSHGRKSPGIARVLLACRPAETPTAASQVYSGAVVVQPVLIFKVEPAYTAEARQARQQGQITLRLIVEPDGKPSGVQIVRPLGIGLDEQAIGAVMEWRFQPGSKDGKPVRVAAEVTVNFRLL